MVGPPFHGDGQDYPPGALVAHRSGPAELDLAQGQCERHGRERDQLVGQAIPSSVQYQEALHRVTNWLGHRSIQHTLRYSELSAERFKDW